MCEVAGRGYQSGRMVTFSHVEAKSVGPETRRVLASRLLLGCSEAVVVVTHGRRRVRFGRHSYCNVEHAVAASGNGGLPNRV